MSAGWLCQHLWEHYAFDPNPDELRRVYPVLKEAARFFLDFLVLETVEQDKDHQNNQEHGPDEKNFGGGIF